MATYVPTPTDVIKGLRTRLDEYKLGAGCITVIKELVQNADDAGATRLYLLVLERGYSESENTLLGGPALLVVNDGPFENRHADNFTRPAGTSKSEESNAIGRFGIGQQSVFHFCEAWLFLGRALGGEVLADAIDPWADARIEATKADPENPDWNVFSEIDRQRVQKLVQDRFDGSSWLALWLPLRAETHRRQRGGFIKDQIWDAASLTQGLGDMSALVELMPQLHNLREIVLTVSASPASTEQKVVRINVEPGSKRLGRPGEDSEPEHSYGEGRVSLQSRQGKQVYEYWLEEIVSDDSLLRALRAHGGWPTVPTHDIDGPRHVPEKALPHGAITIIRPAEGKADASWPDQGLSVGWAVYLPVGQPEHHLLPGEGELQSRWSIRLHGCLFPDHGRRGPLQSQGAQGARNQSRVEDLEAVQTRLESGSGEPRSRVNPLQSRDDWFKNTWNRALQGRVTAPLLLSSLSRAIALSNPDECLPILHALQGSEIYEEHRNSITSRWQLVVEVGEKGCSTTLLPADSRVVAIPRAEVGTPVWSRAIRHVAQNFCGQDVHLTFEGAPCLRSTGSWDAWTPDDLRRLLTEDLLVSIGRSSPAMAWLADFICTVVRGQDAQLAAEVAFDLALAGLRNDEGQLRHADTHHFWQRIVSLIPRTMRFETSAHQVLTLVSGAIGEVLLLPDAVRPRSSVGEPSKGSPGNKWPGREWRSHLLSLSDAIATTVDDESKTFVQRVSQLAAEIIQEIGPQTVLADPTLGERPLFGARSCRNGKITSSAEELIACANDGLAFAPKGMAFIEKTCDRVFAAIAGEEHDVLLLDDYACARAMKIPDLSEASIARIFAGEQGREPSADAGPRSELLQTLLTSRQREGLRELSEWSTERRDFLQGARVLLTGHRRSIGSEQLWIRESSYPLKEDTCRAILGLRDQQWRILPSVVAGGIDQNWRDLLGVRTLDQQPLLDCLEAASADALEQICALADDEALDSLLRFLDDHEHLWNRLPAQRTAQKLRVAASDNRLHRTDGGHAVPAALRPLLLELVHSDDAKVARSQDQRIPLWSPAREVHLCLDIASSLNGSAAVEAPHGMGPLELAQLILAALPRLDEHDLTPLLPRLRGTEWLPLAGGQVVKPCDVLPLPAEVARLSRQWLREDERAFVLLPELNPAIRADHLFTLHVEPLLTSNLSDALEGLALRLSTLDEEVLHRLVVAPDPESLPPLDRVCESRALNDLEGWNLVCAALRAVRAQPVPPGDEEPGIPAQLVEVLCGPLNEPQRCIV